jgi:hypothetical protein
VPIWRKHLAVVQPKDVQHAVSEYCETTSKRVTQRFAQQRQIRLGKFSQPFHNTIVSNLSRSHVDLFFQNLDLAPKTRNHYRADLKAFFDWCVKKDYLTTHHRLNDAEQMHSEAESYRQPIDISQPLFPHHRFHSSSFRFLHAPNPSFVRRP